MLHSLLNFSTRPQNSNLIIDGHNRFTTKLPRMPVTFACVVLQDLLPSSTMRGFSAFGVRCSFMKGLLGFFF